MTHTADSEVQYFQSEGKAIYASVGRGYEALFKYADPAKPDGTWELLEYGSPRWDQVHQMIYRNGRLEEADPADVARLPPLPPIPPRSDRSRESYFLPEQPVRAAEYPALTATLRARGGSLPVYLVLLEDPYETSFGDGCYRDFEAAFLRRADAQRKIQGYYRAFIRKMTVALAGDYLEIPDFKLETFDHIKVLAVFADLEQRLAGTAAGRSG